MAADFGYPQTSHTHNFHKTSCTSATTLPWHKHKACLPVKLPPPPGVQASRPAPTNMKHLTNGSSRWNTSACSVTCNIGHQHSRTPHSLFTQEGSHIGRENRGTRGAPRPPSPKMPHLPLPHAAGSADCMPGDMHAPPSPPLLSRGSCRLSRGCRHPVQVHVRPCAARLGSALATARRRHSTLAARTWGAWT